ncbi:MAG: FAD-dependent oxidoreductase [Streptosporangiales bacterium]|nr:FAD-dependent oxidoreductase [Streptosporangiales bacterium]
MRVVVVGTGVAGAGAGYALARAGVDTILVDSAERGRATSAGAGIVCPWTYGREDPASYRMSAAGAEAYPELLEALAEDGEREVGYRRVGTLQLLTARRASPARSAWPSASSR